MKAVAIFFIVFLFSWSGYAGTAASFRLSGRVPASMDYRIMADGPEFLFMSSFNHQAIYKVEVQDSQNQTVLLGKISKNHSNKIKIPNNDQKQIILTISAI